MNINQAVANIVVRIEDLSKKPYSDAASVIHGILTEWTGTTMTCAYCRKEMEIQKPGDIADHVMQCPDNPIAGLLQKLQPFETAIDDICEAYLNHDDAILRDKAYRLCELRNEFATSVKSRVEAVVELEDKAISTQSPPVATQAAVPAPSPGTVDETPSQSPGAV